MNVRVWLVEGPGISEDCDFLLFDSAEEAGIAAAEAAEYAWDGAEGEPTKAGPAVTIRCYEMPEEEWKAVLEEDDDG